MHQFLTLDELLANPIESPTYCAIGVFDGVHQGHQLILKSMIEEANKASAAPFVFTFQNHPLTHLAPPYAPKRLITKEQKLEILEKTGIEYLAIVEFNEQLASIEPVDFLENVLLNTCNMQKIFCGFNFRFGHRGAGTAEQLNLWAEEKGFQTNIFDPVQLSNHTISSSHIRNLLEEGRVAEASELLTRPYELSGEVVTGKQRGRKLGFPTANIEVEPDRLIPDSGVYAVGVVVDDEIELGMMNLGTTPTFGEEQVRLEVHILDFNQDLYGKTISVLFLEKIRDIVSFNSPDELIAQLNKDKEKTRQMGQKFLSASNNLIQ